MLKTFRENFKQLKWILWLVIAVFVIFVFVDWGMGSARGGGEADVAVKAGSFRVTTGEFEREYRNTEERYRQMMGGKLSPEIARILPDQVMNGLIDRRIMQQEADRLGISVTDGELTARILSMKDSQGRPIFVRDGVFVGERLYRSALSQINMTPEAFEADTRDQIRLEKLNRLLSESVIVTDQEVEDDYATRTQQAKIAYLLVPSASATVPAVTDAEAEAYFKQNPSSYILPERRKGKYLFINSEKLQETVKVTDAEVAAEYNANPEAYKKGDEVKARHILYKSDGPGGDAAAKAKADAALKKLKAGADFAALAKAESEDPGSKASGGDLGFFGHGQMVKDFEDAAFAAPLNQVIGPVKTTYGYHLIEVLEKREPRVQPLFEVSAQIRARLQGTKVEQEMKRLANDLAAKLVKIGKPSDDDMRRLTSPAVTLNETDFMPHDYKGGGLSSWFLDALFQLKPGEVSPQPLIIMRGMAVLRLDEIRKPGPAPFAEVKSKVIADLVKKKQADETSKKLKDALAGGASLEDAAQKLELKVQTSDSFGRRGMVPGLGSSKAVVDAAFAANVGDVKGPVLVDKGAIAFRLLEKTAFDREAFEREKDRTRESIRTQKSQRIVESLIAQRRAELKVQKNEELLKSLRGSGGA